MKISKTLAELLNARWAAIVQRDIGTCNTKKINKHIQYLNHKIRKEIQKRPL